MNVASNFEKKKSLVIFLKSSFWFYLKAEKCIAYAIHISTVNCETFAWRRSIQVIMIILSFGPEIKQICLAPGPGYSAHIGISGTSEPRRIV